MLHALLTLAVAALPVQECTDPVLSYVYDAQGASPDDYLKTCDICNDRVTRVTHVRGVPERLTFSIALPDIADALAAVGAAPTEEMCDGPMEYGAVEYWLHADPPVLFSAAGSACWIQSTAHEAAKLESVVDYYCGGVRASSVRSWNK